MDLSSTTKGTHSELIAATSFLAAGWKVLEPLVPDTYDFALTQDASHEIVKVQVKMITKRTRDGVDYFVIKGRRNTGNPYSLDECDLFAGVYDGKVYVTENRVLSEYWCKVDEADTRWLPLNPLIEGS